jgi:hypothetical protein
MSFSIRHNRVPSALGPDHLLTGTVPVANLGTGTPSNATFLRGDGVWAVPAGSELAVTQASRSAALSIPNNTWTLIPFDVSVLNPVGAHSATVNNSRITGAVGYTRARITCDVALAANATGGRIVEVRMNAGGVHGAGTIISGATLSGNSTIDAVFHSSPKVIPFLPTDYVEAFVFQNRGGALNLTSTFFQVEYLP